ncbi:MAG: 30S ribosomal protein S1 [Anaerolineales bacterium]|nr:30S ribosomal protein S1 [Anaerolineales bacterium]MCB8953118.1 30S ribosomal protein S1 [Ardenticatenales bacterium]
MNTPVTTTNHTPPSPRDTPITFAELLQQYPSRRLQYGQTITGEVLRIDADAVYLDVGAKRDAIVPHSEIKELPETLLNNLTEGTELPVTVTHVPRGDEALLVSIEKGLRQQDWDAIEEIAAVDQTVELTITGYNKGGLVVEFNRLRGFVPNSHVPDLRRIQDQGERLARKSEKVGETLNVKVLEIDRQRERLVLSATAAQKDLRMEQLASLEAGQMITGKVVNLKKYGAFLDLGHVTGLLHISKISWDHVSHPRDVLELGQALKVQVEDVDMKQGRVSLNRQALLPRPWEAFTQHHAEGDLVEGQVTSVVDFGAFVRVDAGIEGLVHISEMGDFSRGGHETSLQPGDIVLARIISIDTPRERIGLSLSRVSQQEQLDWMMARQTQPAKDIEA